jgi:hypothetical protein
MLNLPVDLPTNDQRIIERNHPMNANPLPRHSLQSLAAILFLAAAATVAEARVGTPDTGSPSGMNAPGFGQMAPHHPGGHGPYVGPPYPPYAYPSGQRGSAEPSGGGGTGGFTPGGGSGTKPNKKPNLQ